MKDIVLLTGASGAIGKVLARGLHNAGYPLVLQYNTNSEAIKKLFDDLSKDDTPLLCVKADLTHQSDVENLFSVAKSKLGHVSILINNAGVALPQKLLSDCTMAEYDSVFDVNVRGTILCCKYAIPDMVSSQRGCIINISSVWGLIGGSCEAIYSASKAAVIGLTKSLAKELAPSLVRVNCIAPWFVPSKMNSCLSDSQIDSLRADIPLGKLISAEDVLLAAEYLINADNVTGQTMSVDGGYSIN